MTRPVPDQQPQARSLAEYAEDLARQGARIVPGAPGTFWTQFESAAMVRIPVFDVTPPSPRELSRVMWQGRAAVASYLLEPDEHHPANGWLYVCADRGYSLDGLHPAMRRNVRRGLQELRIAPIGTDELLAYGVQAYCETRRRGGLSDGTPAEFRRRVVARGRLPEVSFLAAWRDDQLAAFLSITEVEDWAELGCFSRDALLRHRPNDTLMYTVLSRYLVERRFRLVSYGLSSIQSESNAAGLHRFKTKVGFEARPVHRAFVPHPLLRPLVNRSTLWGVNTALRLRSGHRRLKKASGVLARMLGEQDGLDIAE